MPVCHGFAADDGESGCTFVFHYSSTFPNFLHSCLFTTDTSSLYLRTVNCKTANTDCERDNHLSGMEDFPDTLPQSGLHTPNLPPVNDATNDYATPTSLKPMPSQQIPRRPIILKDLSQHDVDADPQLKRFQQDLLILTSFNESDTLHWRPLWFRQDPFSAEFWSLYNPPNVVTELLPRQPRTRLVYTRRMRRNGDPPPMYIKTWKHWYNVCDQRGVPHDFLCVDQVELMRLGLPRDENDNICGKSIHSFPNLEH
jgi:hypothetical protein